MQHSSTNDISYPTRPIAPLVGFRLGIEASTKLPSPFGAGSWFAPQPVKRDAMMTAKSLTAALTGAALLAFATPAAAQSASSPQVQAQFVQFTPSANPIKHRIDYSIWDDALKNLVISMGPSLRKTAASRDPGLGSRRIYGHRSRYRLEGSRLMFSFLKPDVISTFTEYREDLERTANNLDIQSLPRNEQLAYWLNLHNVAMVEQIALAWPVRQPRDIKIGGVPVDDAKFITVNGVAMSPKDIRTQIVYPNWTDPRVIYGFWRGEIGSPSIQREAYNGRNLGELLDKGAREMVNSLRGTQKNGSKLMVSSLYEETAPYYFPNFSSDLRKHLLGFADVELQRIISETQETKASITEYDIADLAGGFREMNLANVETNGRANGFRIPRSMARLLAERERKYDIMAREGVRSGRVIFGNVDLPGEAGQADEIE